MISSIRNHRFGKALRLMVCAALALAVTGITTQVIARSAGQHEYGFASSELVAGHAAADSLPRMTVARLR